MEEPGEEAVNGAQGPNGPGEAQEWGGDLAQRARALAERAEELSRQAAEGAAIEDELSRLEAELAMLDEERARLDRDVEDLVSEPEEAESFRSPESEFTVRLTSLGERIGDLVGSVLSSVSGAHDVVEHTLRVGDAPVVEIDSFAGSVSVVRGDAGLVQVHAERHALTDRDLEAIAVTAVEADGRVRVTATKTVGRPLRSWVRLTVTVPPGSETRIDTKGGSINVDGTEAPVRARTAGGSVRIVRTRGDADVQTAGGSIRMDDHDGTVLARTAGGSIRLEGHLAPSVDAETVGGSIVVNGLDGTVRAITKGGSIRAVGRVVGQSEISTAGGSIVVMLGSGSRITVDGSTTGGATSDIDGLVVHERRRIEGAVDGGGEGHLIVRTVGGGLRITRG